MMWILIIVRQKRISGVISLSFYDESLLSSCGHTSIWRIEPYNSWYLRLLVLLTKNLVIVFCLYHLLGVIDSRPCLGSTLLIAFLLKALFLPCYRRSLLYCLVHEHFKLGVLFVLDISTTLIHYVSHLENSTILRALKLAYWSCIDKNACLTP